MPRSGLKKVTKSVRGKHGTVKRSYWVRATEKAKVVGRGIQKGAKVTGKFLSKHKGKIAVGAALAGTYLALRGAQYVKGTGSTTASRAQHKSAHKGAAPVRDTEKTANNAARHATRNAVDHAKRAAAEVAHAGKRAASLRRQTWGGTRFHKQNRRLSLNASNRKGA